MKRSLWSGFLLGAALCVISTVGTASAQTAGQDMHNAGHGVANAAKDTGNGVKRGTTTAYRKTSTGTRRRTTRRRTGPRRSITRPGMGWRRWATRCRESPVRSSADGWALRCFRLGYLAGSELGGRLGRPERSGRQDDQRDPVDVGAEQMDDLHPSGGEQKDVRDAEDKLQRQRCQDEAGDAAEEEREFSARASARTIEQHADDAEDGGGGMEPAHADQQGRAGGEVRGEAGEDAGGGEEGVGECGERAGGADEDGCEDGEDGGARVLGAVAGRGAWRRWGGGGTRR